MLRLILPLKPSIRYTPKGKCLGQSRAQTNQVKSTGGPTVQTPPLKNPKILRDYLSEYLFSTKTSFFAENAPVYNSTPLSFNTFWGESAYRVCRRISISLKRLLFPFLFRLLKRTEIPPDVEKSLSDFSSTLSAERPLILISCRRLSESNTIKHKAF